MDREERLQALNKIEGQLSQYLAADKKNWIQTYLLMSEVQDKELYIVNYRSYTKWINHLADSLSILSFELLYLNSYIHLSYVH